MELKKQSLWICTAAVCGLIGAAVLAWSMKLGAGIGGDATIYITSARNLLAGKGLGLINAAGDFRLIPYFPPFYSLILACCGLFRADLSVAALILNLVFFAGTVYMVTHWTLDVTERLFPALTLGLLFAGSPILIPAYSWAMSEPPAIFTGFLGLILLEKGLMRDDRKAFWGSAVCLGLSFLTRYSSAAFIGAAVILIFFFGAETLKERFGKAFLYGLAAVIPMAVWLVIDFSKTGTVSSRSVLSGKTAELWAAFLPKIRHVFTLWILPESLMNGLPDLLASLVSLFMVLLPLGVVAGAALSLKNGTEYPRYAFMMFLLSVFILLYDLLIVYVSLNTYPPITINTRMLLPVYIAEFWLIFLLFALMGEYDFRPARRLVFNTALFLFMLFSCLRGVRIARQNAIDGLGYHSVSWQNSETIAYLRDRDLASAGEIVTNEETALLYLLDCRSWPMHEVYVSEPDTDYYAYTGGTGIENDPGRQLFRDGKAYLVVFDSFEDQMADIYGDDTQRRIDSLFADLNVLYDGDDGTIYIRDKAPGAAE